MTEKVLRNPTEDELRELQKQKASPAIPLHNKKPTESLKEEETKNFFEPESSTFKIPSGNIVVPSGELKIRRMTTFEEGLFYDLIQSYNEKIRSRENFNEGSFTKIFLSTANAAIDNCIKSGVSVYELLVIDQVSLFVHLLAITYGAEHEFNLFCKTCGKFEKHTINISKIPVKIYDGKIPHPFVLQTTTYKFPVELTFRFLRIKDELGWNDSNIALTDKYLLILENAEGVLPDGNPIEEKHYYEIIKNLNEEDKKAIKKWLNDFSVYGSDLKVTKKICKNKACTEHNKDQEIVLPLETVFQKVFNAI